MVPLPWCPAGKLEVIKSLCHELGVRTEPAKVGGVWIAPIYSWYHASFDREPDVPGAPAVEKVTSCACCCFLSPATLAATVHICQCACNNLPCNVYPRS